MGALLELLKSKMPSAMAESFWFHAADIALCAIVFRVLMGWLLSYRRLGRLILMLLGLAALLAFILFVRLPFARILGILLLIPVLALLVLSLAPEVRRMFEGLSLRHLVFGRRANAVRVAPILAATLAHMARNHVGALLVLPRRDDVDEFLEGGEEVDTDVNRSLLLSIFNTRAPRHDGAAILQGGRVTRIGAVLPLATADQAREEWGTRHLAAIGLTQQCDADVLVVSEERGVVSHARAGRLDVVQPPDEKRIEELLATLLASKQDLWTRVRHNVLSLLLWTAALAAAAAGSLNIERLEKKVFSKPPTMVPVETAVGFQNLPENLFFAETPPEKISVFLNIPGGPGRLGDVKLDPITIDLKDAAPGTTPIALTDRLLGRLPTDWEVVSFQPQQLRIVLAEARTLTADVEPKVGKPLRAEFKLGRLTVDPASVKVSVKDPSWKSGRKLETVPLDLSDIATAGVHPRNVEVALPPTVRPVAGGSSLQVKVSVEAISLAPPPEPAPAPPPPSTQEATPPPANGRNNNR